MKAEVMVKQKYLDTPISFLTFDETGFRTSGPNPRFLSAVRITLTLEII